MTILIVPSDHGSPVRVVCLGSRSLERSARGMGCSPRPDAMLPTVARRAAGRTSRRAVTPGPVLHQADDAARRVGDERDRRARGRRHSTRRCRLRSRRRRHRPSRTRRGRRYSASPGTRSRRTAGARGRAAALAALRRPARAPGGRWDRRRSAGSGPVSRGSPVDRRTVVPVTGRTKAASPSVLAGRSGHRVHRPTSADLWPSLRPGRSARDCHAGDRRPSGPVVGSRERRLPGGNATATGPGHHRRPAAWGVA